MKRRADRLDNGLILSRGTPRHSVGTTVRSEGCTKGMGKLNFKPTLSHALQKASHCHIEFTQSLGTVYANVLHEERCNVR